MEKKKVVSITVAKTKKAVTKKTVVKKAATKTVTNKTTTKKMASNDAAKKPVTKKKAPQKIEPVVVNVAGVHMTFDPSLSFIYKSNNDIEGNKILISRSSILSAKVNQTFKTVNLYDGDKLLSTSTSEITPAITGKKMVASADKTKSSITTNEYDNRGKLVSSKLPGSFEKYFSYYASGEPQKKVEKWLLNGTTTITEYNKKGEEINCRSYDISNKLTYSFSRTKRNGNCYTRESDDEEIREMVTNKDNNIIFEKRSTSDQISALTIFEAPEKDKHGIYQEKGLLKISKKVDDKSKHYSYKVDIYRDSNHNNEIESSTIKNSKGSAVYVGRTKRLRNNGDHFIKYQNLIKIDGVYDELVGKFIFEDLCDTVTYGIPTQYITHTIKAAGINVFDAKTYYKEYNSCDTTFVVKSGINTFSSRTTEVNKLTYIDNGKEPIDSNIISKKCGLDFNSSTNNISAELNYCVGDSTITEQSSKYTVSSRRNSKAPIYEMTKIYTKSVALHVATDYDDLYEYILYSNPKIDRLMLNAQKSLYNTFIDECIKNRMDKKL